MKKIALVHGPNLNLLGKRDKNYYGDLTLEVLEVSVKEEALKRDMEVECFQSNHEGGLIDFLQKKTGGVDGIIINPGALTHYSYALHDALVDTGLACVEVHLSDVENREEWRKISVTAPACIAKISGKQEQGYIEAIDILHEKLT
jgi:3-dehydroquinate dehydratase II